MYIFETDLEGEI